MKLGIQLHLVDYYFRALPRFSIVWVSTIVGQPSITGFKRRSYSHAPKQIRITLRSMKL